MACENGLQESHSLTPMTCEDDYWKILALQPNACKDDFKKSKGLQPMTCEDDYRKQWSNNQCLANGLTTKMLVKMISRNTKLTIKDV